MIQISKVFISNGKLTVYIPYEVTSALDIKDGDEVDFFKYKNKYFIFAKKSDVTNLLLKAYNANASTSANNNNNNESSHSVKFDTIGPNEVEVLKKLDQIKYKDRDSQNVKSILDEDELKILFKLIKNKAVLKFKSKEGKDLYSISKDVYGAYLMGTRGSLSKPDNNVIGNPNSNPNYKNAEGISQKADTSKKFSLGEDQNQKKEIIDETEKYINELQSNGYIVVPSEEEATNISIALEDSIRAGSVVGTRAFNKKFYIAMKSFISRNSPKLLEVIKDNPLSVQDIAKQIGIDEESVRSILYILAENGEVTELKKDLFKIA